MTPTLSACSDRDSYGGGREPRGYMERTTGGSYREPYDGYGKILNFSVLEELKDVPKQRCVLLGQDGLMSIQIVEGTFKASLLLKSYNFRITLKKSLIRFFFFFSSFFEPFQELSLNQTRSKVVKLQSILLTLFLKETSWTSVNLV